MRKASLAQIRTLRHNESLPESEPRRYRNASGYIRLRWKVGPQRYVEEYEHRIAAGRPHPRFHVHHINGIKDDNRPENLEVLTPEEHGRRHLENVEKLLAARGIGRGQRYAPYRGKAAMEKAQRRQAREAERRAEVEEMRRMYEAGATVVEIGEALGIDNTNVSRRMRAAGVWMRTSTDYANPVDVARLVEQYSGGRSLQSLAAEYRVTASRVSALLEKADCPRRKPGRPKAHPVMSENSGRLKVRKRSGGICERCGARRACEWHHRRNRSQGGDWSPANGVDLCSQCHQYVGEHPTESYRIGWLVPNGVTPEEWPVHRWTPDGPRWMQPGEVWVEASPHPRQTEESAA